MFRVVLLVLFICAPALARDNGQYSQVSPEIRDWFRAQKSLKTGRGETKISCYAPGGGV